MDSASSKAEIQPIQTELIARAGEFLHRHMSGRFSAQKWQECLLQTWNRDVPNHGFALVREDGEVVGVLCALYSKQKIAGQWLDICNPHSWCVLPEYRKQSISLVLAVIQQPGFHFTMFTPNQSGLEIFAYLGFKPMDKGILWAPNWPTSPFSRKVRFVTDMQQARTLLSEEQARILTDHLAYDWLLPLVMQAAEHAVLVIIKRQKYKRAKAAQLLYVSDYEKLLEHWSAFRSHLLLRHHIFTTRLENRFLPEGKSIRGITDEGHQRFYLSDQLQPHQVQYIYSEMAALKL